MDNITQLYIYLQIAGIGILLFELLYVLLQKPSNLQKILTVLIITCIVSFIAYYFELSAKTEEEAMMGCLMGYVGKPFSLIATLMFFAEYSHIKIKRWVFLSITLFFVAITALVFTYKYHPLYYTSVYFDIEKQGSGLTLGHGFFWYVYMISSFILLVVYTTIGVLEYKKSFTSQAKAMTVYIMLMLFACFVGLFCFIFKFTGGYDTTLAGTFVGSIFLLILLVKYRIFESLELSKDRTLRHANYACIIFDGRTRISYYNNLALEMFPELNGKINDFEFSEKLDSLNKEEPYFFDNKAYKLEVNDIIETSRKKIIMIGKTYTLTDITEQLNYQERLKHDVFEKTRKIKSIQSTVLISFANLIEARDGYTGAHNKNVSKYARKITESLRNNPKYSYIITDQMVNVIEDCAPLHDVGKILIPDSILGKPGKLTQEEFEKMKEHASKGAEIINSIFKDIEEELYLEFASEIAECHHEWYNGTGYPNKLKGDEIPLAARIMAVSDVYDALRMKRPYKDEFSKEKSISIIKEESGTHFDPDVVNAFLDIADTIEE